MKTYSITICHMAYSTIEVEAENEDQAANKAWQKWDGETEGGSNDITEIEEI